MRTGLTAILVAMTLTSLPAKAEDVLPSLFGAQLQARSHVPLPPRRGEGGSVYAIVSRAASRHGVPQSLAHAVIHVESRYNCHARNRSGASGLGQLMPATARSLGVRNVMSCEQNADGAMAYLGRMYRAARGNACVAASGYNSGSVRGCSAYGRRVLHLASR